MRPFRLLAVTGLLASLAACAPGYYADPVYAGGYAPAYVGPGYVGGYYGRPGYAYGAPRYVAPPIRHGWGGGGGWGGRGQGGGSFARGPSPGGGARSGGWNPRSGGGRRGRG